jgi:hypothetical protein
MNKKEKKITAKNLAFYFFPYPTDLETARVRWLASVTAFRK